MIKQIPYGITKFETIIRDNCYFVDKTMFIPRLEEIGRFLFYLRPRRFGKSVFVDMLESYYDIKAKSKFDLLFGNLWIGKNPTPQANQYQVMRFDFSMAVAPIDKLYETFNQYCCERINHFIQKYGEYYDDYTLERIRLTDNAGLKLTILATAAKDKNIPLYLIIDEYDNFTNVVLANYGKEQFHKLTHAEGFYRDFFKILKPTFDRIFMMGVSPVTMDDLTSGFNIGIDISQFANFNSMLGFSEEEVYEILTYYKSHKKITREIDDVIMEMRPWYNNYCFAEECCGKESVYNCTMTLNYLNNLIITGSAPKDMLDKNTRTDYNKLKQLIEIGKGVHREGRRDIISDIANSGNIDIKLVNSFSALDITEDDNFCSMIYYYGMLTMGYPKGIRIQMIIPNQSVRLQYWDYILNLYQREYRIPSSQLYEYFDMMAFEGEWQPLMQYLGSEYERTSSIRDVIGGEHNVQGFVKAYLSMCNYHIFCPEIEMGYGYSDFLMVPQLHRFPNAKHSYIIETKYAKPSATDSEIGQLSKNADQQLAKYLSDTKLKPLLEDTTVHPIKLIFHGAKLVICSYIES